MIERTETAPSYKMVLIDDGKTKKPGLVLTEDDGKEGEGERSLGFPLEIWRMPNEQLASFLRLIPEPLGLGKLRLKSGQYVSGFICQGGNYPDISEFGGWANFIDRMSNEV